jgi:hypothetical protein
MVLTLQATSAVAQVRIGKGAAEAKEAEEAEQKVDRTVSHLTPSARCTSRNSALIGGEDRIEARPVHLSTR